MSENNDPGSQTSSPSTKTDQVETAQMTEVATLGNVFFEPGRTFEDIRRKPRFLLAGLICLMLFSVFQIAYVEKIGLKTIVRDRYESSSRTAGMSSEQKEERINQESSDIAKWVTYAATPVVMIIYFLLGGLLYWGGTNAMGGSATFLRGLSVFIYSTFPPTLLFSVTNLLVLFLKKVEDIDIGRSQQGLIQANLGFFIDAKSQPVLASLLGSFDLFAIIGWTLAAIGLQKIGKISSGAAWALILIIALVWITTKVVATYFFS